MKKLIFGLVFMLLLSVTVNAQSRWNNFLDPKVTPEMLKITVGEKAGGNFEFLPRPTVFFTGKAIKLKYIGEEKFRGIDTTTTSRLGIGLSLNHYKSREDGTLYVNYGFTGGLCINPATTNIGIIIGVSTLEVWKFSINFGLGYDFCHQPDIKKFGNKVLANSMLLYGLRINY
jgi:hypothetical protein